MAPMKRALSVVAVLVCVVAAAAVAAGYACLRGSLPILDGRLTLPGLTADVSVERDVLGIPTLRAANREDLARATGFVHAQDRFFQMDLMRRSAAGELAELVGEVAVPLDEKVRLHGMRAVARQVLAQAPPWQRRLLDAYTDGVNAGLAALRVRPFEYLLLRSEPRPWRPEDTIMVIFAMYFELQDPWALREARLQALRETLPEPLYRFLTAPGCEWDAPLDGSQVEHARLPSAQEYDLRHHRSVAVSGGGEPAADGFAVGSNNWAIGPAHSADGAAWLANDMHLRLNLPHIWYRMHWLWHEDGQPRMATGVTLPGTPALVVGSNGRIAWGFTNSYGDFADRILLELDPSDPQRYRTPQGYRPFERRQERIAVKGGGERVVEFRDTIWGPVLPDSDEAAPQALAWTAHRPQATNLDLLRLEAVDDAGEALTVAAGVGVPAQNFVVVDRHGNIGWTIIGRLPRRHGYDPNLPASWADGAGWQGWLAAEDYPRLLNPAGGRIWTANNRVVGGDWLRLIGDGGLQLGSRATQIRDGLLALERAGAEDLLRLQLDDRALFLARWRTLLLDVLDERALAGEPRRQALRAAVEDWGGRASVDSVGYRLVRAFRLYLMDEVFTALTAEVRERYPEFRYHDMPQGEGALWRLVSERPAHLLDPAYADWREQLLAVVDRVIERLWDDRHGFDHATWGAYNRLRMQHPLSKALPLLGFWLDMPAAALPGDAHMPRVQTPVAGASQRLVVSPGREGESLLHMPGGQSGHPLSPFYRAGHDDWAAGRPAPLLPGPTRHALVLAPEG